MEPIQNELSPYQMELVLNKEWLLTKREIIKNVFTLFGHLHDDYKEIAKESSAQLTFLPWDRMGKISRGDNYEGLPYIILDYPAIFTREKIVAVRSLFWWGHFFSLQLHLGGTAFSGKHAIEWLTHLKKHNFFISLGQKEWRHDFRADNFIPIQFPAQQAERVAKADFFKTAKKLDLGKWNEAEMFFKQGFKEILRFLTISFPGGEIDPSPVFPKGDSGL